MAKLNPDQTAVVVDQDGKVKFYAKGPFAETEARQHLRFCQAPKNPKARVDHLSKASVITGKEAEKALERGRA